MDINCHQSLTAHQGAGLKNVFNAIQFPIANTLASFLETTDLINLSRTSISCYYAFKAVKSSQWNINNFLSPFLRDPRSFRSVMAECDAVISGSTALQFFDRVRWSESDLDIYIHIGESVHHKSQPIVLKTLGYHLMEKEGYQYTPDRRQHPDFNLAGTIREKLDNPEDEDGGEIYQLNDKIAGVNTNIVHFIHQTANNYEGLYIFQNTKRRPRASKGDPDHHDNKPASPMHSPISLHRRAKSDHLEQGIFIISQSNLHRSHNSRDQSAVE
jgi:hypothetical protein